MAPNPPSTTQKGGETSQKPNDERGEREKKSLEELEILRQAAEVSTFKMGLNSTMELCGGSLLLLLLSLLSLFFFVLSLFYFSLFSFSFFFFGMNLKKNCVNFLLHYFDSITLRITGPSHLLSRARRLSRRVQSDFHSDEALVSNLFYFSFSFSFPKGD